MRYVCSKFRNWSLKHFGTIENMRGKSKKLYISAERKEKLFCRGCSASKKGLTEILFMSCQAAAAASHAAACDEEKRI